MVLMHTLVQACLRGVPPEVETIARDEELTPHNAARAVARGRIVIPANPARPHRLCAIGEGCRVRVNVNLGTSGIRCDEDLEVEKAKAALREGADTLMDLSTAGDLARIRRRILEFDAPVGTVPVRPPETLPASAAGYSSLMHLSGLSRSTRLSGGRGTLRTWMPTSSLTSSGNTANRASTS